jgi:hypothetical protein
MTTAHGSNGRAILDRIVSALLWIAAFAFATGIFFSLTLLIRNFPPTPPVAVGRVTIERASKFQDYFTAALYFFTVPLLAVWLRGIGARIEAAVRRRFAGVERRRRSLASVAMVFFALPYLLSSFFYLTTGKVGWILLLPLVLSFAVPALIVTVEETRWLRSLFRREMYPFHAAIVFEAVSWIVFRYIATGHRIAHVPTLFLETIFFGFFVAVFWLAVVLSARLASFTIGLPFELAVQRFAVAGLPLIALPLMVVALVPPLAAILATMVFFAATIVVAMRGRGPIEGRSLRRIVVYAVVPLLLYAVSYASTILLAQWLDLFHRGESVGPASDYLRGKIPYRDVFVLHGLLEDGMLDAWLMQIFGRRIEVAAARPVVLGSFLPPTLWFLGMTIFDSIPLGLLVVAMGSWTTAENDRTFFQIAVVALLWFALRRRRPWAAVAAGVFSAVALFFSYEIGVYSIVGAFASLAAIAIIDRKRRTWDGLSLGRAGALVTAGLAIGALPFVIFLAARGGLAEFAETSFLTIPRIIDAVWSLPFPDLVSTFRLDLNLHTISDFILFEKFHLILSFLVIGLALTYCLDRWRRRRLGEVDLALMVLTIFATITQRSALGRAELRHQYFSAFLIGPILVLLAVLLFRRVREAWSATENGGRAFLVMAGLTTAGLIAVLLWIPDLVNSRIDDLILYRPRVYKVVHDPVAERVLDRIAVVSYEIDRATRLNDPIFDFSNQPAFYFFANRPNPTRFYQVPIASPPRFQAEAIRALDRFKPKLVLRTSPEKFDLFDGIPNSIRAQAIAAYIDDRYVFYKSVRGVELWKRKPEAPHADLAGYLRTIRLPSRTVINEAGRERLLFPTVGSLPGIDAFWRSDLVIHNPFTDPMTLRLRYVSEQKKLDRDITIGAGQIMRWEDVVRTWFFAPETSGVLWVEYRANRQPVCRVKTYDSSHQSSGSLYDPLTIRDAASAEGELKDLTIVGIRGGPYRRVNLGVVNVGDVPATFRITARDSLGRKIGNEIEEGLSEDAPWLLVDTGNALGVELDESVSLHVEMRAGTGIAYASVIDGLTHEMQLIPAVPSLRP